MSDDEHANLIGTPQEQGLCSYMHLPTPHVGSLDPECPLCGKPRCHRKVHSSDMRCRQYPAKGNEKKCRFHGGLKRLAQVERARVGCENFGIPIEGIDPVTALSDELARTAGAVAWLEQKVKDISDAEDLIFGVVKESVTENGPAYAEYQASVNGWVQLWQAERDRLVRVSKVCLQAGIDERKVRAMEEVGSSILALLNNVFSRLELNTRQQALLATVVPEELRRHGKASSNANRAQTVPSIGE